MDEKFYVEIEISCFSGKEVIAFMITGIKEKEEVKKIFTDDKTRVRIFVSINIPMRTEYRILKVHQLSVDGELKVKEFHDRKRILNLERYGLRLIHRSFEDSEFNRGKPSFLHIYQNSQSIQTFGTTDIVNAVNRISEDMGYMISYEKRILMSCNHDDDIYSVLSANEGNGEFIFLIQDLRLDKMIDFISKVSKLGYYPSCHFYSYDEIRKEVYSVIVSKDMTIKKIRDVSIPI